MPKYSKAYFSTKKKNKAFFTNQIFYIPTLGLHFFIILIELLIYPLLILKLNKN